MKHLLLWVVALCVSVSAKGQFLSSHSSDKIRTRNFTEVHIKGAKKVTYSTSEMRGDSVYANPFNLLEEYSFKRNKLRKLAFKYPLGDSISLIYFFDKKGRIERQERLGKNAFWPRIEYSYNEKERISKEVCYDVNSEKDESTIIYYNNSYKPVKKEFYKKGDILTNYILYEYNPIGDLVKELRINTPQGYGMTVDASITGGESIFTPWPTDTITYLLAYDSLNRIVEKKRYSNSKITDFVTTTYFRDSTVSITIKYNGFRGTASKHIETTERPNSKTVLSKDMDRGVFTNDWSKTQYVNGEMREYETQWYGYRHYVYTVKQTLDKKRNWIQKETFENGKLIGINKRTILY